MSAADFALKSVANVIKLLQSEKDHGEPLLSCLNDLSKLVAMVGSNTDMDENELLAFSIIYNLSGALDYEGNKSDFNGTLLGCIRNLVAFVSRKRNPPKPHFGSLNFPPQPVFGPWGSMAPGGLHRFERTPVAGQSIFSVPETSATIGQSVFSVPATSATSNHAFGTTSFAGCPSSGTFGFKQ